MPMTGLKRRIPLPIESISPFIKAGKPFFLVRVAFFMIINTKPMVKSIKTLWGSFTIFFAGLWLVVRIILEYFGIISDGNDRTTGIKDLREEYKKANYK